jgi:hypothetical protein
LERIMSAIQTRYVGPTNTRGSRIKAWCDAGSITIPYPHHANSEEEKHRIAAEALQKKLGWLPAPGNLYGDLIGDCLPGGGYAFVDDDRRLLAIKGFVNSVRNATWSGNPWCKPEFRNAVAAIGRAHGFFGDCLDAPTRPDEISAWEARRG